MHPADPGLFALTAVNAAPLVAVSVAASWVAARMLLRRQTPYAQVPLARLLAVDFLALSGFLVPFWWVGVRYFQHALVFGIALVGLRFLVFQETAHPSSWRDSAFTAGALVLAFIPISYGFH